MKQNEMKIEETFTKVFSDIMSIPRTIMDGECKLLLAKIIELDNLEYGCIARNEQFAQWLGIEQNKVSIRISKLVNQGYVNRTLIYTDRKEVEKRILVPTFSWREVSTKSDIGIDEIGDRNIRIRDEVSTNTIKIIDNLIDNIIDNTIKNIEDNLIDNKVNSTDIGPVYRTKGKIENEKEFIVEEQSYPNEKEAMSYTDIRKKQSELKQKIIKEVGNIATSHIGWIEIIEKEIFTNMVGKNRIGPEAEQYIDEYIQLERRIRESDI